MQEDNEGQMLAPHSIGQTLRDFDPLEALKKLRRSEPPNTTQPTGHMAGYNQFMPPGYKAVIGGV